MGDQLWEIEEYSQMFNEDDNEELFKEIKEEELVQAIKSMKGDKSSGPDGWIIEFFAHFIDIFQEDPIQLVEESRTKGFIHPYLNSTYISLPLNEPKINWFLLFQISQNITKVSILLHLLRLLPHFRHSSIVIN